MTLTLSHKAHSDIVTMYSHFEKFCKTNDMDDRRWYGLDDTPYSTEEIFNDLDEVYGGLIPHQDLGTGTYVWVCSYAGTYFYASQTPDEDGQSTITINDSTTIVGTNTCRCNTCSCKRKVALTQDI